MVQIIQWMNIRMEEEAKEYNVSYGGVSGRQKHLRWKGIDEFLELD